MLGLGWHRARHIGSFSLFMTVMQHGSNCSCIWRQWNNIQLNTIVGWVSEKITSPWIDEFDRGIWAPQGDELRPRNLDAPGWRTSFYRIIYCLQVIIYMHIDNIFYLLFHFQNFTCAPGFVCNATRPDATARYVASCSRKHSSFF